MKRYTNELTDVQVMQIDLIDNSIYELCDEIFHNGKSSLRTKIAAKNLFFVLGTIVETQRKYLSDILNEENVIEEIVEIADKYLGDYLELGEFDRNLELPWDMEYIGQIAEDVSEFICNKGIPVYYPYILDDKYTFDYYYENEE